MNVNTILELMYAGCGLVCVISGVYAFKDNGNKEKIGSAIFWVLLGITFILGPHIKPEYIGGILIVMGCISLFNKISIGSLVESDKEYREKRSSQIGDKIFIPALTIGVVSFAVAQFTSLGGLVGLGFGSLSALILAMILTKEKAKYIPYDSARLLQQMGPTVILPQLLGALGALFAKAGVGVIIASLLKNIIPQDSRFIGILVYCVGMALFTIIMGNAFAAFTVITAGIGLPFVINLGANPTIVGALGLTAGYCGTLLTPMAANFNIIPTAVLEINDKNAVIKAQAPVAALLLVIHIILMYILAF